MLAKFVRRTLFAITFYLAMLTQLKPRRTLFAIPCSLVMLAKTARRTLFAIPF